MANARTAAARALDWRARLRRSAKQAVAWLALHSGALARVRRGRGDVILLYHRVVTDASELLDYSPYGVSVAVDTFAAQMRYLADHYEVVPLEALAQRASGRRPRCAITFDDGWRDNLTAAWPILRRHGFPATIFLATNMMDGGPWFWEERAMALLAHCHQVHARDAGRLAALLAVDEIAVVLRAESGQVPRALARLIAHLKDDPARRAIVLAALDDAVRQPGVQPPRWFLSWDEVRQLAAAGVAFGGHTASHANLATCSEVALDDEVADCKRALDRHLGPGSRPFAYPYGKNTPAVRAAVAGAGFTCASTTERRLLRAGDDLYGLPRVDVYEDVAESVPLFACRIACFMNVF